MPRSRKISPRLWHDRPWLAATMAFFLSYSMILVGNLAWSMLLALQIQRFHWLLFAQFLGCVATNSLSGWIVGRVVQVVFPATGFRGVRGLWMVIVPFFSFRLLTYIAHPSDPEVPLAVPSMALAGFAIPLVSLLVLRPQK